LRTSGLLKTSNGCLSRLHAVSRATSNRPRCLLPSTKSVLHRTAASAAPECKRRQQGTAGRGRSNVPARTSPGNHAALRYDLPVAGSTANKPKRLNRCHACNTCQRHQVIGLEQVSCVQHVSAAPRKSVCGRGCRQRPPPWRLKLTLKLAKELLAGTVSCLAAL
jgi:hypothetical protein